MRHSSDKKAQKGATPLLTGISKIHISPDTGRLSISVDATFAKQIDISATVIEESVKDVFSLGLAILNTIATRVPNPGEFNAEEIFRQIDTLEKISAADIKEDTEVDALFVPWVFRAIRLPEKDLLSITLQKPYIKALKVLSILLEMEVKELLTLSAQIVQTILSTVNYLDMTQKQIYVAIKLQVDKLLRDKI